MILKAKWKYQGRDPRKNLLQCVNLEAKSHHKTWKHLDPTVYLLHQNQKSKIKKKNNLKTKVLASKIPT